MDKLTCALEVKFASGGDAPAGVFTGYGAVFGNVDSYGDVIQKGAFRDTLREAKKTGRMPKMLLEHGMGFGALDGIPCGAWTSMEEDDIGLKVEGSLFAMNTERGQYIYEGLKAGAIDGLSIGYRVKDASYGTRPEDPRRTLKKIDLHEVSIVTFPANDLARTDGVKTEIDEINTLSDAERFLCEMGGRFSRKSATAFVSRLKRLSQREADESAEVRSMIERFQALRA